MNRVVKIVARGFARVGSTALVVAGMTHIFAAQGAAQTVGEVRTMAVAPTNQEAVAQLHRDGWLETRGQLLPTEEFPELFSAIGRRWTADHVDENRFAIPALQDVPRTISTDNPYGVLDPADLISSGRLKRAWRTGNAVTYWIYTGKEVHAAASTTASK